MASCAIDGCGNPECQVCTVSSRFAIVPCQGVVDGAACRFVAGHHPPCVASTRAGKTEQALRDGDPKLAAERKRGNLAFSKRQRAGPNWVPPNRRV